MYTQQVFKKSLNGFNRAQVLNYIYEQDYIAEKQRIEQESEISLLTQQLNAKTSQLKRLERHADLIELQEEEMLFLRDALTKSEQAYQMLQQEHELLQSRLTEYIANDTVVQSADTSNDAEHQPNGETIDQDRLNHLESEISRLRRQNEELENNIRSHSTDNQSSAIIARQESEIRRLREKTLQMTELIETIRVRFNEIEDANQLLSQQLTDAQNINSLNMEQLKLQSGQIIEKDKNLHETIFQLEQHKQTIEKQEQHLKELIESHDAKIQQLTTDYDSKIEEKDAIIDELRKNEELYQVELIGKQQQLQYMEKVIASQKQQLEQKEQQIQSVQRTNSIQQSQLAQKDEQIKLFKHIQQEQKRDIEIKLHEIMAMKQLLNERVANANTEVVPNPPNTETAVVEPATEPVVEQVDITTEQASESVAEHTPVEEQATLEPVMPQTSVTEQPTLEPVGAQASSVQQSTKPSRLRNVTATIADFLNVAHGNAPKSTVTNQVSGLPTYTTVNNFPTGQNSTQTVPNVQQLTPGVSLNSSMVNNVSQATVSRAKPIYGGPLLTPNTLNTTVDIDTDVNIGMLQPTPPVSPITEIPIGLPNIKNDEPIDLSAPQPEDELPKPNIPVIPEIPVAEDFFENPTNSPSNSSIVDSNLEALVSELQSSTDWASLSYSDIKSEQTKKPSDPVYNSDEAEQNITPYLLSTASRHNSAGATHAKLKTFSEGDGFESTVTGTRHNDSEISAHLSNGNVRMVKPEAPPVIEKAPEITVTPEEQAPIIDDRHSRAKRFEGIKPKRADDGLFKVSKKPSIDELRPRN